MNQKIIPASCPNIIRAYQKDQLIIEQLKQRLKSLAHNVKALRRWVIVAENEDFEFVAKVFYFCFCTGIGSLTLGEEFSSIFPFSETSRNFPQTLTRIALLILEVCTPYAMYKSNLLNTNPKLSAVSDFIKSNFSHLHLSFFYLFGTYYCISRRFLNLKYLSTQKPGSSQAMSLELLGYLGLLYTALKLVQNLKPSLQILYHSLMKEESKAKKVEDETESTVPQALRCILCYGKREHSTLTNCGHLFCWNCIHEWSFTKNECPVCRRALIKSQFYRIYN